MGTVPVRHLFFTNAPGRDGTEGYRFIYRTEDWPEVDRSRLLRWLEGLSVQPPESSGWAVNTFRLREVIHSCLVRVDGAFSPDRHSRGKGHLAHLLAVPMEKGVPELPSLPSMMAILRDLSRSDDQRGELSSLEREAAAITHLPTESSEERLPDLESISPGFLGSYLQAFFVVQPGGEIGLPVSEGEDLPSLLARATIALPARLRLGMRWVVGLQQGVVAGFTARPESDSGGAQTEPGVEQYLDWLLERIAADDLRSIRMVIDDWNIRSWDRLLERIGS